MRSYSPCDFWHENPGCHPDEVHHSKNRPREVGRQILRVYKVTDHNSAIEELAQNEKSDDSDLVTPSDANHEQTSGGNKVG